MKFKDLEHNFNEKVIYNMAGYGDTIYILESCKVKYDKAVKQYVYTAQLKDVNSNSIINVPLYLVRSMEDG